MCESEVLPYAFVIDHEPGKVSLEIHDDPRGKAHDKADGEPCEARLPEHARVVPEPEPQQGQEGEPVDVDKPEPEPCGESQEHGIRPRGLLLREHFEEEKHGQRGEHDRF